MVSSRGVAPRIHRPTIDFGATLAEHGDLAEAAAGITAVVGPDTKVTHVVADQGQVVDGEPHTRRVSGARRIELTDTATLQDTSVEQSSYAEFTGVP